MDTAIPEPNPTHRDTSKRLSPAQRSAICAEVASGKTIGQVAEQFGVHRNSVSVLVNNVRKMTNTPALARSQQNWRETVVIKSQTAIDAGLDCADDPYKRAAVGTAVMKGLGEFAGDNQVNVFVNAVGSLPADLRSEYLSSDDVIEASVVGSDDLQVVVDPSTIA